MTKSFEVKIVVSYDESAPIPDMETELRENVKSCIACSELLNDANLEAVVEDYSIVVKRLD